MYSRKSLFDGRDNKALHEAQETGIWSQLGHRLAYLLPVDNINVPHFLTFTLETLLESPNGDTFILQDWISKKVPPPLPQLLNKIPAQKSNMAFFWLLNLPPSSQGRQRHRAVHCTLLENRGFPLPTLLDELQLICDSCTFTFTSHPTYIARIFVQALVSDWCFSKPGPKAFLKCKHSTTPSLTTHLAPNPITHISIIFSIQRSLFSSAGASRKKIINRSL